MKIKEGFQLREVCGEYVVVAYGMKNIDFSKVINLNESAADMWKAVVGKEFTVEDLKNALLDTYDVSEEQAFADAQRVAAEGRLEADGAGHGIILLGFRHHFPDIGCSGRSAAKYFSPSIQIPDGVRIVRHTKLLHQC